MGFEVFKKSSAPAPTVPTVTIQKRGLISLNHAAKVLLGEPEAVELLWDADEKLIALRPAETSNPDAYPVRSVGGAKNKASGTGLVAGTLFTRHIGIDTSEARRWTPRFEGNLLIVDLKSPSQVVISNRERAKSPEDERAKLPEEEGGD